MAKIRIIVPTLLIAGLAQAAPPANVACIDAAEYRQLRQNYDDLFARFDLETVTQRFIDVSSETSDLKDQIKACRASPGQADGQNCDALAAQYDARMGERKSIQDRLGTALDMHEYLSTLKLRLEQPQCEK